MSNIHHYYMGIFRWYAKHPETLVSTYQDKMRFYSDEVIL